jgi:DNA-binding FadR family transcriptional regulator
MPEGRRRGLSVPKASDVLADSLRQRILSGELPTGSALPVERELAATTRLSRTAVREALRILEIEGLIEIRPGRSGGSFVRRPSVHAIGRTVDTFITGRGITLRALLEVREALEPAGAELAARNRTDTDMDLLDDATARLEQALDDPARFLVANIEWHEAVVRASGNELLYAFMRSLSRVVHRATSDAHFDSDETRRLTARAHRKILGAIRDQDAMAARAAMERHVHAYRVEIESVAVPDELMVEADDDRARREEI